MLALNLLLLVAIAIFACTIKADVYDELGESTFRSSKNILFAATLGGSSHSSWVARLLNELTLRGHRVTYAATDTQMKYTEPYPHIDTEDLGGGFWVKLNAHNRTFPRPWNDFKNEININTENYGKIYTRIQQIMSVNSFDVIICDQFSTECSDAARISGIPSIQTMVMNLSPDSFAPYINKCRILLGETTTEHMSLPYRFYKKFMFPIAAHWHLGEAREKFRQKRMELTGDMAPPADPARNSLKIVNNFYGIEEARPMGPLVEMIGPIYNAVYDPLPPSIKDFLDKHERVVFVAFGQHASAKPFDTKRILEELLSLVESNLIDGIVWGVVKSSAGLPDTVTTKSGRTYDIKDLWEDEKHPNVRLLPWAPQFAILNHPSVITFLSHGGGMSIFEALYAGKRTVIKPFFGDQPGHALHFEREQLGGYLKLAEPEAFETLRRVIEDKDGTIQNNIKRYQALVQIRAKHAVTRGADLVEEVIFTSVNGHLPHRLDVARRLSYLKANDYDLGLCLAAIILGLGLTTRFVYLRMKNHYQRGQSQQQHKSKQM
ncbi:hypothetical protein BDB00DRAFT_758169 [Zychaea mexicana]|uniref:uncharacterized protein n=1 Tax=Zychaea mexicana TaxID=64656 RepID=UPI0022FE3AE5|nr:uncharacterized protein BDB00DRAFT_758169 [Zychaea mexicana]KAI9496722.1 hypothetical protein BDB00DRAFT_758169 [Zychaea mexicana]